MTERAIHLGKSLDNTVLDRLADFVCGDNKQYPMYRTGSELTRFFQDNNINAVHDGTTRKWWVLGVLQQLDGPQIEKVILRLVDPRVYGGINDQLKLAFKSMNEILFLEDIAVRFQGKTPILVENQGIGVDMNSLMEVDLTSQTGEQEFLQRRFDDDIKISDLGITDLTISQILQDRINELQSRASGKMHLGSIFLIGSTMEGMILGCLLRDCAKYMSSNKAPKDKSGKVKKIYDWKLYEMIEVAHDSGILGEDVRKFSQALRDFRNYIHPYEQMSHNFRPDSHTVDICWQVFKAAFYDLREKHDN